MPVCPRHQTGYRSCQALKWKQRIWIASYFTLVRYVACSLLVQPGGICWSRLKTGVTSGLAPAVARNGAGAQGSGSWWSKSIMERRQFCVRSHQCQLSLKTKLACCAWCMWPASWSLETHRLRRFWQWWKNWQQDRESRMKTYSAMFQ